MPRIIRRRCGSTRLCPTRRASATAMRPRCPPPIPRCCARKPLSGRPPNPMSFAGSPRSTRSEEHTSALPSLIRTSYAGFCLKKKHRRRSQIFSTRDKKGRIQETDSCPTPIVTDGETTKSVIYQTHRHVKHTNDVYYI